MISIRRITRNFSKSATKSAPSAVSIDDIRNSGLMNFNITNDLYRIDLGLLIERPAIFLPFENVEIDKLNKDSEFYFKHGLRYEPDSTLLEFNHDDPLREYKNKDTCNLESHMKVYEDGRRQFYHEHSKKYENTDPQMQDPKSIQYCPFNAVYLLVKHNDGEWGVPYKSLESRQSVELCMNRLKIGLLGGKLMLKEKEDYPVGAMVHEVEKAEVEKNKILTKLEGRKVFLYTAFHNTGEVSLEGEDLYEDFRWVPKAHLNKYLSRENFERIVDLTSLY